jgi:chaperonin GroEL (HSP60 family)
LLTQLLGFASCPQALLETSPKRVCCPEPRINKLILSCNAHAAAERSATLEGVEAGPYKAAGQALEVIPRTLAQNCGANVIRTLTKLRAKHAESPAGSPCPFGINGETGECGSAFAC